MSIDDRHIQWGALESNVFDVAVIGGGINGVCLYHHLCMRGFSVLLVDKGDFACSTSQASAMMIWGGLLYLRHGDLLTVRRLCASRDRMLREMSGWIKPHRFRYIPARGWGRRAAAVVHAALHFYWLLGGCHRLRPRRESDFPERGFLLQDRHGPSLTYEEACVQPSDARFVLHWLFPHQNGAGTALNYCSLEGGAFDRTSREWRLDLSDSLIGKQGCARARWVINAAGVWTDGINNRFSLDSPFRHVLSKGVFLALHRNPRHELPLILDTRGHGDEMSLIPWGPVSLWGPTETVVNAPEDGFAIQPGDIRYLIDELNRHLRHSITPHDVISLRCGVRPLVVDQSHRHNGHSRDLSRRHRIHVDRHRPWISVFGGKLTNCIGLAGEVTRLLRSLLSPRRSHAKAAARRLPELEWEPYPALDEEVPSAPWCAEHEMCWNLEDYLRRRTNISQWVPRGGLGMHNEHLPHLVGIAGAFSRNGDDSAREQVKAYERKIRTCFDQVLSEC